MRVGCGASKCSGGAIYAYCNYAIGQGDTVKPYASAGQTCTNCAANNCRNKLCYCDKLCQNDGQLDLKACKCNCNSGYTGQLCEISS